MRHVTATEARQNWFALLDEAANGEIIAIRRNGRKLVLRLEDAGTAAPDYESLIDFPDADDADTWGWDWKGPGEVRPVTRRRAGP